MYSQSPASTHCEFPQRVWPPTAAPGLSLVNDIVVHECGRVNDLDHRTQPHRAPSLVVEELRGQQQKGRPDAFPAAFPQVFTDLGDGRHIRNRVPPELRLNRQQIVVQEFRRSLSR